jgi:hypothetical protein
VRSEAKKAIIWLGIAALMALAVVLAQPLLVVFGGMVFGAMIDGGARLIGRVLPIPRILRVGLVLAMAVAFILWFVTYAGGQIAEQAAAARHTERPDHQDPALERGPWLCLQRPHAPDADRARAGRDQRIARPCRRVHRRGDHAVPDLVLGIYFAIDPAPYQRGLGWLLPRESRPYFRICSPRWATPCVGCCSGG